MRKLLTLLVVGLLFCPAARGADRVPDSAAAAGNAVRVALNAERTGESDRRKKLQSTLRTSPDFAPARWQSGYVRRNGTWVPFDRLPDDATLAEYRRLRDAAPNTVAGHLRLAGWCAKQGLPRQRRAHLTAVLEFQPEHAAARKALGHVRAGGRWVSLRRLRRNEELAKQAVKNLKRWVPKLQRIRNDLKSGKPGRVAAARKRLAGITDPGAAGAAELVLAYDNPGLARLLLDYLAGQRHPQATLALARQAIVSPWKSIRKDAAEKLTTRKLEHFVPQVLAVTSQPIQSRRMLYVDRSGSLLYRDVFYREGRNARDLVVADHLERRVSRTVERVVSTGENISEFDSLFPRLNNDDRITQTVLSAPRSRIDSARRIADRRHRNERAADESNRRSAELNRRAQALLSRVSGRTFNGNAKQMWDWWDAYSEVWTSGVKPLKTKYVRSTSVDVIQNYRFSRASCLAAGTPVWTDRGPVAIEKVRIGDCVLSQNVDSGELAYKPVLKTTIRPKTPMLKLEIGPRTIHLTGGHPFWISGKGWMKARDITDGMRMHDVTGTTAVRPAGNAKAEPAYNLIVADFHTYFVGEAKVLSHDNTPIAPTGALVPGLVSR